MDAPPIQYARTEDGVNIAYWTLGERSNPALVIVPWGIGHLTVEWQVEPLRAWCERLARSFFLVAYDPRGSGSSQREVTDLALERFVADLATVTAQVELHHYTLLSFARGAMVSITHAVERPEAVTHLALWAPLARGFDEAEGRPLGDAREADWAAFRSMVGLAIVGYAHPDEGAIIATLLDKASSPGGYQALSDATDQWDVRELLPQVQASTLVFGIDGWRPAPLRVAQNITAAIPNARLLTVTDDVAGYMQFGDREKYAAAIEALVFGETVDEDESFPAAFRTILFTDLESSIALTQKLGDDKAQEILHGHNDAVRSALAAHDGEEVKHTGDGIMASFGSAVSAVRAALQLQHDLAGGEIRVRIGINAGEPIAEDHDYFGTAVQLAARLCDRAEPGQVLVSNVVRELCAGKTFTFNDLGPATLKGFDDPVPLYAVSSPSP